MLVSVISIVFFPRLHTAQFKYTVTMAKTMIIVDGKDDAVPPTVPPKRKPAAKKAKTEKKEAGRVTKRRSPKHKKMCIFKDKGVIIFKKLR